MQTNTTRFSRLVDLAKETSSDKRRELLREVTDAFLATASDCNETEKSYFGEILGSVSSNMDVAVRSRLAQQFAGQDHAPLGLIQKLADLPAKFRAAEIAAAMDGKVHRHDHRIVGGRLNDRAGN